MLYNEFKDRTNLNVSEEEFQHINAIYMSCGAGIDNPTFCKNYPAVHANPIVEELFQGIERQSRQIEKLYSHLKMMKKAYFTVIGNPADIRARRTAVQAYDSEGEYIRDLLAANIELSQADKEYIMENII